MSNYRQQSGGTLGSLTTCPTCYDTLTLGYAPSNTNEETACCGTIGGSSAPYSVTVYVAQGSTFSTATMFYSDTSLTTVSSAGWYTENVAAGSRNVRLRDNDPGGNPQLGAASACAVCSTVVQSIKEGSSAYDACCGNDQPGQYYIAYGSTFLNATAIYDNAQLSSPLSGWFFSTSDGKVKQFNSSAPAGQPQDCATCFETLTGIRYSNTDAEDVCCDVTATGTYYVAQGETFATATTLYTDQALTVVAPGGFYSND